MMAQSVRRLVLFLFFFTTSLASIPSPGTFHRGVNYSLRFKRSYGDHGVDFDNITGWFFHCIQEYLATAARTPPVAPRVTDFYPSPTYRCTKGGETSPDLFTIEELRPGQRWLTYDRISAVMKEFDDAWWDWVGVEGEVPPHAFEIWTTGTGSQIVLNGRFSGDGVEGLEVGNVTIA